MLTPLFYIIMFIFMIIGIIIICWLQLMQIGFGLYYMNSNVCNDSIVPINVWLIINGFSNIFFTVILNLLEKDEVTKIKRSVIVISIFLFNIIWLTIGSIVFWRDCIDLEPKSINTLMWFSLIMKCIHFFI